MMDWNTVILSKIKKILTSISTTQNLIGATNDTNGDETKGTLMAKGNAILAKLNTISNVENLFGKPNDTGGSQTAGSMMAKLNAMLGTMKSDGVPIVKSVQRGTAVLMAATRPLNISINTINPEKSIVLLDCSEYIGSSGTRESIGAYLNSLEANRLEILFVAANNIYVSWQVVEFY